MRILIVFLSIFLLVSCAQQAPLTEEDEKYVFVFKDIDEIDLEHYTIQKLKSGKDYFYSKGISFLGIQFFSNEPSSLYTEKYIDEEGDKIELYTGTHISKNIERAKELVESIKTRSYSRNPISVDKVINKNTIADDLWISKDSNELFIVLRSKNIVYDLQIVGLNLRITQVWPTLSRKFEYLKKVTLKQSL